VAKSRAREELAGLQPKFGLRELFRLTSWGSCAACALFVAGFAATTDVGRARLLVAAAEFRENLASPGTKSVRPLDAREGRRLAETVRELTADRDPLLARIAALEHSLDGTTGSIGRGDRGARVTAWPSSATTAPNPAPAEAAPDSASSDIHASSDTPLPLPPQGSTVVKTEFGLDLGTATSTEALRAAWTAALRRHGALLQGMRAMVQTRERGRAGAVELRLIAGPIANASAAARICAALTAAGGICAPTVFGGQQLAVR
jgi:hypothetical protein